jgi:hypothetical protein
MRRFAHGPSRNRAIDNEPWSPDTSIAMGEYKAKTDDPRRLLLRLKSPVNEPMVVEANLEHHFLERVWKLC